VIIGLDVCDDIAPTVDEISVSPDTLWPPNHKYVDVTASVSVSDNFDPIPTVTLISVTSNEADNGLGDGDTASDILIVDDFRFKLRAERSGKGRGRVYAITYLVADACRSMKDPRRKLLKSRAQTMKRGSSRCWTMSLQRNIPFCDGEVFSLDRGLLMGATTQVAEIII